MKLKDKRLFLLDMDGTIYLGDRLFDCTPRFLAHLQTYDIRYMFFTNNSSKSTAQYLQKLAKMGIVANIEQMISSTRATIAYLAKHYAGKRVYAFGTAAFTDELRLAGINVTTGLEENIDILVMGFDTELNFQKLEDACVLLGRGVEYIATNPDLVCPTEYGSVPDCGSVAEMLKNATTREPVFIGKPSPLMVEIALAQANIPKEQVLLVGDRLYTDIACGTAAGVDTALVLSGESTRDDAKTSPHQPTYIFGDLDGLLKEME